MSQAAPPPLSRQREITGWAVPAAGEEVTDGQRPRRWLRWAGAGLARKEEEQWERGGAG